jgi:hypothetical protein
MHSHAVHAIEARPLIQICSAPFFWAYCQSGKTVSSVNCLERFKK